MILLVLCGIVFLLLAGLIIYARWNYGTLEKMGVRVDKPHFILGNTYYTYHKPGGLLDIENFKRLGPVYGVYEGREPQIHVADAELIRLITTKDADYFNAKRILDFRDPLLNELLDFQPNDKWKMLRSCLSPQFSLAKLKNMGASMTETCSDWSSTLKENVASCPEGKLVKYDLRSSIFAMLTEMLARCCFTMKIGNPSDPENKFVNLVRGLMEPTNLLPPFVEVLTYSFPFVSKFFPGIFDRKITTALLDLFQEIIQARRHLRSSQPNDTNDSDMLDFFITLMDRVDTPEFKRLKITKNTVTAQAVMAFFGGQDQVSSIVATMIYHLLLNPDMEAAAYAEIDAAIGQNGQISYETLAKLPYLNAALTETARLVPFFSRTERVTTKDWTNEEFNLHIKKGMVININIWSANRNPKYWSDPERFDPTRFLGGRKEKLHPYAHSSWGFGPRGCFGQKFSYDMLLLVGAFLLKNFKFHLREDSKPEYVPAGVQFTPHMPFYFDVTTRP